MTDGGKEPVDRAEGDGGESEEEAEEAEDRVVSDGKNAAEEVDEEGGGDSVAAKIKQVAQQQQQQQQAGGAILAQSDISSSQLDFFKMLDEKIENGPDYEGDDEEEEKARLAGLLQEWKAASMARQQKKAEALQEQEKWSSPARSVTYADDYGSYPLRGVSSVDTQRFPTGYSPCPPNAGIGIHLQNAFRAPPFADQARMQPRPPYAYHPYQPGPEALNHCEDAPGHPLTTGEPPNPLRANYPVRQMTPHHYHENQRLYPGQYPDSPRTYVEPRSYTLPRVMPTVNVLHDQRVYVQEGRPFYQDARQNVVIPYQDQRPDVQRVLPEQKIYHERMMEVRTFDGQRPHVTFQRPPLLAQRSFQEPPRIYRDLDAEECFQRQERFDQDGASPRGPNFKMGRSVSVDVQYVAGPPPPREIIPLQGAPGPPQGSPRPLTARGLQMNMHRLPSNSVVQFRKSRGAFTELA
ncbi:UNVERIFIED_CONTAM: hypothetical protein PYX00_003265 [Menopon gallinae]|uniref:Uncharacterized protein n=1 Tax=Menopon gallinae TaxID=328185 RepID=A0AAW2I0M9_9NEOP